MKTLFALFFLLISFLSLAQVKDVVPGSYGIGTKTVKNYIKNPYCFANTKDIVASDGASVTKTSSSLEGESSCAISSSGAGGKVKFSARALDPIRKNGQCLISFAYSGDGTKWKGYVESNSIKISNEAFFIDSGTNPQDENYISYSCGDLSSPTYFVLEALGTAPVFKLSSVSLTKDYLLTNQNVAYNFKDYGPTPLPGATTTPPTKPTTRVTDRVLCGQVGPRFLCDYDYYHTNNTGSAQGNGGYIHSLPVGAPDFDDSYPLDSNLASTTYRAVMHQSIVGWCSFDVPGGGTLGDKGSLIATGPRTFQCITWYNATTSAVHGSSYGHYNYASMGFKFHLDYRGKGLQSSVPTYTGRCNDRKNCNTRFTAIVDGSCNFGSNTLGFFLGCSGTTTKIFTFYKTLKTTPNCGAIAVGGTGATSAITSSISTTSYSVTTYAGTTATSSGVVVWCDLQGADFDDAFTLQQNVALKNYSKTEISSGNGTDDFSFSFGATATTGCTSGTCAYLDQIGGYVLSVVYNSTGLYTVNFNKTYSKIKCSWGGGGSGSSSNIIADPLSCSSCSSMPLRTVTYAGSPSNTFATISCKGMY